MCWRPMGRCVKGVCGWRVGGLAGVCGACDENGLARRPHRAHGVVLQLGGGEGCARHAEAGGEGAAYGEPGTAEAVGEATGEQRHLRGHRPT